MKKEGLIQFNEKINERISKIRSKYRRIRNKVINPEFSFINNQNIPLSQFYLKMVAKIEKINEQIFELEEIIEEVEELMSFY